MVEDDTIKLLRECSAGIQMGIHGIEEVLPKAQTEEVKKLLLTALEKHQKLKTEISSLLEKSGDDDKSQNPFAQSMAWMKSNMKMAVDDSDSTIADLMTDGCDMGIKSLNRYLNQYEAADKQAKKLTADLIQVEQDLEDGLRRYL